MSDDTSITDADDLEHLTGSGLIGPHGVALRLRALVGGES